MFVCVLVYVFVRREYSILCGVIWFVVVVLICVYVYICLRCVCAWL